MKINEEDKTISVYLKPSEVSLAIGKGGSNIKLAGQLAGYEIDVYREAAEEEAQDEEDVLLQDFSDEIEEWVIKALQSIGCDTAKSVLALDVDEIVRRADLEEETVVEVQKILRSEFE